MRRRGWAIPRGRYEREAHAIRRARERPDAMGSVLASLVRVLARGPVRSQTKLRRAVRAELGPVRDGDVDAAVELLGRGVQRTKGVRGATVYTLDASALSREWRELLKARDAQ